MHLRTQRQSLPAVAQESSLFKRRTWFQVWFIQFEQITVNQSSVFKYPFRGWMEKARLKTIWIQVKSSQCFKTLGWAFFSTKSPWNQRLVNCLQRVSGKQGASGSVGLRRALCARETRRRLLEEKQGHECSRLVTCPGTQRSLEYNRASITTHQAVCRNLNFSLSTKYLHPLHSKI